MIGPFRGKYGFLSNFYASVIVIPRVGGLPPPEMTEFATLEHAFQTFKTDSMAWAEMIRKAPTPRDAKRLGRQAPMRGDWEVVKDIVMLELLRLKFMKVDLREELLATGDEELVEVNTWGDTYWGQYNGFGENRLGNLLMRVRTEIKESIRANSLSD